MDYRVANDICLGFDFNSMLDFERITIDDLLVDHGFFETDGLKNIFQSIIKNKLKREDITLQELYDLTQIQLTVKVFNVTKKQIEYLSYLNYPELSVITLAQMTTAIPVFFKPVQYNGQIYVDGGLRGHFPIEVCKSENYLGIFIAGGSFPKDSQMIQLFPLLEFLYSLMINQDEVVYQIKKKNINPRIIYNEVNLGLDFNVKKETKERVIQEGYENAIKHIETYLLNK